MNNNNYKILFIVIAILVTLPILVVTITNSSLIDDASNYFLNALSAYDDGANWYVEDSSFHRARMSSMFFSFLPLNIAHTIFGIDNLGTLSHIYSATLFILPIIACGYSIFLLARAKKKFYAIFPLFLLAIGYLPIFAYGCVESNLSTFYFLILFFYFLLNLKLKIYDYVIFSLLSIAAFNLHESIVLIAPILLYTYLKHSDKTVKIYTFNIILIVVSAILHFFYAFTSFGPNILFDNAVPSTFQSLYFGILFWENINFFPFLYLISFINFYFIFRYYNIKKVILVALSSLGFTALLFFNFNLYTYKFYRFFPIYLLIILMIYLLKRQNKSMLYMETLFKRSIPFLIVSFLIANIYICTYSFQQYKFTKSLVTYAKEGYFFFNDVDYYKNDNFYGKNILRFNNHLSILPYSIIAINSADTKGLLIANDKESVFAECDGEKIRVNGSALNIKAKTKYWDLSKIKPYIHKEFLDENY